MLQEWWVQMTLLIEPSIQVVIAVSDNASLLDGT